MRRAYPVMLLSLLALVFAVNSVVDLAGTGSRGKVAALAARQGPDDILVAETDFDQRVWVRERLKKTCPEILIAGSSTVGGFAADLFSWRSILDAWLTGPTIADYEGLWSVLEEARCRPRWVILGVDPWLVDAKMGNDRWLSLYWQVLRYAGTRISLKDLVGPVWVLWSTFKERLSFVTTLKSIEWLLEHRGLSDKGGLRLTTTPLAPTCAAAGAELRVRFADGHFVGCPRWALDAAGVEAVARRYATGDPHGVVASAGPDPELVRRLERVVARHRGRGARVLLVTPPYHPGAYAGLRALPAVATHLDQLDAELRRIAAATDSRFVALRDPAVVGCAPDEFLDSHHAGEACLRREAIRIMLEIDGP